MAKHTPQKISSIVAFLCSVLLWASTASAHLIPIDCYYNAYTEEFIVAYYWDEQNLWQYFFAWRCPLYGAQRDINAGDEGIPMSDIVNAFDNLNPDGNSAPTPDPPDSDQEPGDMGDF